MWIPPHIRSIGGSPLRLILIASVCAAGSCGCTSIPKFSDSPEPIGVTAMSPDLNRTPAFDAPVSAADSDRPGPISETAAFQWDPLASSADGRDIEGITIGQTGYRTLVLGSLAGNDPVAISLTEQLAEYLHQNRLILGGVHSQIVKNPNPDGLAMSRRENGNGVYLNSEFPTVASVNNDLQNVEPEIRFILGTVREFQPQRVIHIRTFNGDRGIVASSPGAEDAARDVAVWLGFGFVELPGNSSDGTLEQFLSTSKTCDIVTIAIPASSKTNRVRESYLDAILNLLLADDYTTRELARSKSNRASADRRGDKNYDESD
ncbi:MAG: murein peptide amidase A [Fuerstiella sp.]|nr:murein peptide amidase A [Fuerstiella sp.]MCP4858559.1 murein peptide amidase A [Fuerstiella sp.]